MLRYHQCTWIITSLLHKVKGSQKLDWGGPVGWVMSSKRASMVPRSDPRSREDDEWRCPPLFPLGISGATSTKEGSMLSHDTEAQLNIPAQDLGLPRGSGGTPRSNLGTLYLLDYNHYIEVLYTERNTHHSKVGPIDWACRVVNAHKCGYDREY